MGTNPWRVYVMGEPAIAFCAGDRIDLVRASCNPKWLRAARDWPDTQKTVRRAVERQLRKVTVA
jgi:hypothetical protein